ncbi:hypothetical protein [Actinoplanes sp. NPDC020271]|uniref:hypothetical protein n=1 Tax=Actinoplanes sp. NPDC020271 TaxID=3363896 RepID=UPI00378AEAD7
MHRIALRRRPRPSTTERSAIIAASLANQALGDLDVDLRATGVRIARLLTAALPGLDIGSSVRLLLRLTGRHRALGPASLHGLILDVEDAARSGD